MAEQQASAAVPAALQKETISISAPAHDSGVKPEDAKTVGPKESPKTPEQPAARGWRFWLIFLPLCISTLLAALESTVTSTALPTIVRDLNTGDNYAWILNGYLLTRLEDFEYPCPRNQSLMLL